MIIGYFSAKQNHPFVKAEICIDITPTYVVHGQMDFLLDTGADNTFLMPDDGKLAIGINYQRIPMSTVPVQTPYGEVGASRCTAYIGFKDNNQPVIYQYNIPLLIYPDTSLFSYRPSALGRDIFDFWHIDYSVPRNTLSFDVTRADRNIRFP